MSERPLHVQVAEALGWRGLIFGVAKDPRSGYRTPCGSTYNYATNWYGIPPGYESYHPVDPYDTDWRATGPQIERFRIKLDPAVTRDGWCVFARDGTDEYGDTLLEAVCNLILALHAAGKLR